jgi:D-erythronate 2-dehydrogenase
MARALDRVAGAPLSDLIDWVEDPVVADIVSTWPARIRAARAAALGLHADASFDDIVRDYLADNPGARA